MKTLNLSLLLFLGMILVSCQSDSARPYTPPTSDEINSEAEPAGNVSSQESLDIPSQGIKKSYSNTNRMIWQKPEMIQNLLGDLSGKTVADIGAGDGFFAKRLAQYAEKVIAIDVDPNFLAELDSSVVMEVPEQFQSRIETRLATYTDPKLSPGEADIVLIVNTYVFLPNRVEYMRNIWQDLPDEGRVMIIDFKKKRMPVGHVNNIKVPLFEVEDELLKAGFSQVQTNDTALDYQYIVIAGK